MTTRPPPCNQYLEREPALSGDCSVRTHEATVRICWSNREFSTDVRHSLGTVSLSNHTVTNNNMRHQERCGSSEAHPATWADTQGASRFGGDVAPSDAAKQQCDVQH